MKYATVALFVYNRPLHLKQTVDYLKQNFIARESELIIFSDAPKKEEHEQGVESVRKYIKQISGFKDIVIIERDKNWGLANSIISGVSQVLDANEKVIILEDDLLTSPHFLNFMNDALDLYFYDDVVASVHGYIYPTKKKLPETFFLKYADCWGWGTWKRAWPLFEVDAQKLLDNILSKALSYKFDFDGSYVYTDMLKDQINGKVNSWAIRWQASLFLANKLSLYPSESLVMNIGHDGSGFHGSGIDVKTCTFKDPYGAKITTKQFKVIGIKPYENIFAYKQIAKFFVKHRNNETYLDLVKKFIPKNIKSFFKKMVLYD